MLRNFQKCSENVSIVVARSKQPETERYVLADPPRVLVSLLQNSWKVVSVDQIKSVLGLQLISCNTILHLQQQCLGAPMMLANSYIYGAYSSSSRNGATRTALGLQIVLLLLVKLQSTLLIQLQSSLYCIDRALQVIYLYCCCRLRLQYCSSCTACTGISILYR